MILWQFLGFLFVLKCSQGYFQHSLWAQCEFLDGHSYKVSPWGFEWFTWTNKGVDWGYLLIIPIQFLQIFVLKLLLHHEAYACEILGDQHQTYYETKNVTCFLYLLSHASPPQNCLTIVLILNLLQVSFSLFFNLLCTLTSRGLLGQ